ncbi:unnamed protein product [Peniophora sp. CBMAI 1063]|nr:unnamed protein product [Peniophora sp. CBMAI 1063]
MYENTGYRPELGSYSRDRRAELAFGKHAVNRDIVTVEVFDPKDWKAPADEVVDQEVTLKIADVEDSEDEGEPLEPIGEELRILKEEEDARRAAERQPTGRIVGIVKRNWRTYVCHIDSTSLTSESSTSMSQQTVFTPPVSRLIPRIRMHTRQAPSLLGQKILVTIDRWDVTSRYPEGHFVRALGRAESKEAEQESLLLEFGVPYRCGSIPEQMYELAWCDARKLERVHARRVPIHDFHHGFIISKIYRSHHHHRYPFYSTDVTARHRHRAPAPKHA